MISDLMDVDEVERYLKLDKQTIYNWLHQKKLTGIKMGHVWRFDKKDIDKWLAMQTINVGAKE